MDFLAELPRIFRERFLNTHEAYLIALNNVISRLYLGWDRNNPNYAQTAALLRTQSTAGAFPIHLEDHPAEEQAQFRHLRNSWYHELALRQPEDIEVHLKFAGWKITQAYYSVFSSVAAMVRCIYPDPSKRFRHGETLDVYARELVASGRFSGCFLPPANSYLNQQSKPVNMEAFDVLDEAWQYEVPSLLNCLNSARKGKPSITTFIHYLKAFREWATYEDAYLLFRMYGPTVKDNVDRALQTLTSFYLPMSEVFLIRAFGFDAVKLQFISFLAQSKALMGTEHPHLESRFQAYEKYLL